MKHILPVIRLLRPLQWLKNAVVAVPFFFAFGDLFQRKELQEELPQKVLMVVAAMVAFSLVSSAVYVLNDICDREQDRLHPEKKFRPIASGEVSVTLALWMIPFLLLVAFGVGYPVGMGFLGILLLYVVLQLAYSFGLKRVALLDVFIIALGFVLRIFAGGKAVDVELSMWLILCTFLLALFLGMCKRRQELGVRSEELGVATALSPTRHRAVLEQYSLGALDLYSAMTGTAVIVCYAIYTLSPETVGKFGTQALAWTVPLVTFGIFRYIHLVHWHKGGGRPEKTLVTDIPIMLTVVFYGLAVLGIFFVK